jgi:hypothetical protein
MGGEGFLDYYEMLQLSPNADVDTIERVFRHQAKRLHPDTSEKGDTDKFYRIVEAHRTLTDPQSRAAYDAKYQDYWNGKWKLASEASNKSAFSDDVITRERLLSLLYVQRRRNMENPGMGEYDIARLLCIPFELVEFHMWYLKNKGWVERLDTGYLAITVQGVDQVEQSQLLIMPDHLLEAQSHARDNVQEREETNGEIKLVSK